MVTKDTIVKQRRTIDMATQPNGFIQKQMALQKAISRMPSDLKQQLAFDRLSERLKSIVRENAELDANEIERQIAKDKYRDEPRIYQEAVEPTYADDNWRCRHINDTMMSINETCEQLNVDKMFPAACENYSYDRIVTSAKEYAENVRLIDDLNAEKEMQQQVHKNLPRKERAPRDMDNIVDDVIDGINKENRHEYGA